MNIKYSYIIILLFCFNCKNKTTTETTKKIPITVKATLVEAHDLKEYLSFNGVTKYQKKENIRAGVTGYISRLNFKIGDAIKKHQVFASIRTKEQEALSEAVKIDSSLSKFTSPLRINSNSTGVISLLNVQENDYVSEGDILATISQPNSLVIEVNVPYEYETYFKMGTECDIILQNNQTITAKITGVLPIIDVIAQSQTFLIALPNQRLPENLNVIVKTIYKKSSQSISIPHEALQTNELMTDFWVMKITNDSLAIKTPVKPLLSNDSLVEVKSNNLKLNDWVVTEGSYQMQDSTLVSIQNK